MAKKALSCENMDRREVQISDAEDQSQRSQNDDRADFRLDHKQHGLPRSAARADEVSDQVVLRQDQTSKGTLWMQREIKRRSIKTNLRYRICTLQKGMQARSPSFYFY